MRQDEDFIQAQLERCIKIHGAFNAIQHNNPGELLRAIEEHDADVNSTEDSITPLYLATIMRQKALIKILRDHGAYLLYKESYSNFSRWDESLSETRRQYYYQTLRRPYCQTAYDLVRDMLETDPDDRTLRDYSRWLGQQLDQIIYIRELGPSGKGRENDDIPPKSAAKLF